MKDLGIGGAGVALAALDWQAFDFVPGARYFVQASNMSNVPAGIQIPAGTLTACINVTGYEGSNRHVEIWYSTTTDVNYLHYEVRIAGATGSRTYTVRKFVTSSDVMPSPKLSRGDGYTLFQTPFLDGTTLRWFSTLTMAITPATLGNNQTFSVSFPIAFSSDVGGAMSDTDGQNGAGSTVQDLGMRITGIGNTGMTIMSRWQAVPADFGQIRFVITGVIDE